jgi:hypothetical protein
MYIDVALVRSALALPEGAMFMKRLMIGMLTSILLLASAPLAMGWGVGHRDIAAQVFDHLPKEIADKIPADARDLAIQKFALYPDSGEPFLAGDIGQDAVDMLHANGIPNRYAIHFDKGRAMAFVLLVDAFEQHRYDHAAAWIAALSHSTSDMAALNHDPLLHWIIYNAYNLQLEQIKSKSDLRIFEIHSLVTELGPEGNAIWSQAVEKMILPDDGRDATRALLDILEYGNEGADFCAQRALPILNAALQGTLHHDDKAQLKAETLLAELGGWAVGRTVRDTCVAYRLASQGVHVELTPQILHQFDVATAAFMHARKITDDQIFVPILRPLAPGHAAPLAVLVEPDWRMNDAFLGYEDRIIAASICRTLANAGRDYATLDVRDLLTDGAPDPRRVPILVISATGGNYTNGVLRDLNWMHVADFNQRLKTYLDAGGHIVWIGGTALPPDALAAISKAAGPIEKKQRVPVKELLGDDSALRQTRLTLVGQPGQSWPFVRPVVMKDGWTQAWCPWKFTALSPALHPLLELQSGDEDTVVGVLWNPPARATPAAAFIPIYSMAPRLLSPDDILEHPTEPQLDQPSQTILFHLLDLFGQRGGAN